MAKTNSWRELKARTRYLEKRLKSGLRKIERLIKTLEPHDTVYLRGTLEDLHYAYSKQLIKSKQLEKKLKKLKGEK